MLRGGGGKKRRTVVEDLRWTQQLNIKKNGLFSFLYYKGQGWVSCIGPSFALNSTAELDRKIWIHLSHDCWCAGRRITSMKVVSDNASTINEFLIMHLRSVRRWMARERTTWNTVQQDLKSVLRDESLRLVSQRKFCHKIRWFKTISKGYRIKL